MTRINVGIRPSELCDQHLIAEYRELPRLFGRTSRNPAPSQFVLSAGHLLWCQQFQNSLAVRFVRLVEEMRLRGFAPRFRHPPMGAGSGASWSSADEQRARPILRRRLLTRLKHMASHPNPQHHPRWTRRPVPAWTKD